MRGLASDNSVMDSVVSQQLGSGGSSRQREQRQTSEGLQMWRLHFVLDSRQG